MNLITSPDIVMFNFLNLGLENIRGNLERNITNSTPQKSWLYKLWGNLRLQRYEFFNQGKSVFLTDVDNPRHLTIDMTYNKKKDQPVNMFLSLGSENSSQNTLNIGGEDEESIYLDNTDLLEVSKQYSRRYDRSMSVYIYTDNSNETILIYETLKALILAYTEHLELMGLRNLVVSGQDISQYPEFIPKDFFYRVLSIKFNYESKSIDLDAVELIDCFKFNGLPVGE